MDGLDDQSLNSLYCVDPESLDGERRQRQGQPLSPSMVPVSPMSMSTLDVRNNEYSNNRSSPAAAAAYRAWQRSCCLDDLRAANAESAPSDVFTSAYTRHMITRQSNMSPTTAVSATASSMQAFTADSHQGCNELAQHSSAIESRGEYVHPSRPLSDTVVSDAETYRPMSYTFSTDEQETYNSRYEAMDGSYTGDASEYIDYGQAFIENGHAIESEFGNGADSLRHELLDPDMTIQVPDHASLEQAGVLSDTTTSPTPNPAMPNASAIAQIFAIGQPTRPKGYKGMSKARRLSKRLLRALPKQLWPGGRYPHPLTEADRVCSDALLSTFTAESSLFNAIRLLERTRSTRSSSFRIRADRVHTSQSQLLNCIFELFIQLVPEEEQRSRHYRYYLPEDDQIELDRGFSESVLFAAQALARGFQIRGTEMHTQSLREPAWLLCSAWAAVRYVIFARGSSLWCIWDHGLMHQDEHEASTSPLLSSPASPSSSISPQDELGALRGVLEDFDEAWVKFERDLCFAYFGLSSAQPTGSVDSEQSDGQATQEEEFSLLVVLLYYLPEDDQIELDRGFSESVLFAAQALARGFQIRGTEMHTQSLREPAWLLCSAWAAVRYVIFARGSSLWCIWDHGLMHQDEHEASTSPLLSSPASPSSSISPQDELGALRGVLEDFDEAWVKFERDLCFAYFGLSSAQPTGSVDSEQSDGQATQEEEFSLLVVLLSETLQRSIAQGLVSEEQMEAMEPQLILALPRLAILHAVAHGGVDGLQFVESEDTKVFWWFREYAELCRRASEEVGKWGAVRYEVLQNMLAAEEADIVWAESEDAVYMSLFGAKQALASEALSLPKPSQGLPANKMAKSTSASPSPIASPRIQLAPRLVASAAALQTPAAMDAKGAPRSRDMALCREKTRQVYVDICTVADSLHSGQFARPFRVALELVFRMNTAAATASSHSASESS
ncbi:hypothetical protein GGI12_004401 [Dipsacomyces acuminosporus]|nr:hypothetical protein GGI12_004401 [Dipsacomyces acuminosporus]